jgi:branched-chain amino acid transport system permease protein
MTRERVIATAASTFLIVILAAAPVGLSPFQLRLGLSIFISAGMAVSWYILGGFVSYYSFGHTAFVGVGAFAAALVLGYLHPTHWFVELLVGLGSSMLACALVAAAIARPLLRLRGHYFTIAMLAVALVCAEAVSAFPVLRGSIGISLPDVTPQELTPELFFYWITLVALLVVLMSAVIIARSRLGYGLFAIREDEDAAEMLGVPTTNSKIVAFVISATLTGMMGALYAFNLAYITTESVFRTSLSLDMVVNSLVGGMSSLAGPLLGTLIMTLVTNALFGDVLEYHLALTGIIIILIVFFAPSGLIGIVRGAMRLLIQQKALN